MADQNKSNLETGSEFHAASGDVQTHALVSIAFSLKRIADALSYQSGDENLYDLIREIRSK